MSEREPTYEELYAERNGQVSSWWSEERTEEQRQRWRKAQAAYNAAQRRGRHRSKPKGIGRATLGYRPRSDTSEAKINYSDDSQRS